ncbi:hypothetical protein CALCODRAFT_499941, partial [Calocera cornea HHB12733]
MLGISHSLQHKFVDALQAHTAAAEGFESMGDLAEAALSRRQTAQICASMGRSLEALEIISDVIVTYDSLGEKLRCAGCLLELGAWLEALGRFEEALQQYHVALQICKDLDLEQGIALFKCGASGALMKLAFRDISNPDYDAAELAGQLLTESLAVFDRVEQMDPMLNMMTSPNPMGMSLAELRAALKRDSAALWMLPGRSVENSLKLVEGALTIFTESANQLEIAACKFMRACLLMIPFEEGSQQPLERPVPELEGPVPALDGLDPPPEDSSNPTLEGSGPEPVGSDAAPEGTDSTPDGWELVPAGSDPARDATEAMAVAYQLLHEVEVPEGSFILKARLSSLLVAVENIVD